MTRASLSPKRSTVRRRASPIVSWSNGTSTAPWAYAAETAGGTAVAGMVRLLDGRTRRPYAVSRARGMPLTVRLCLLFGKPVTRRAPMRPELTRRERYVLATLCRPLLAADVFVEPASVRQIADALVVTEASVKQHLLHLCDKFGSAEAGERRRVRLAKEAVRQGGVDV